MTIQKAIAAAVVAVTTALLTIIGPGKGFDALGTVDYLALALAVLSSGGLTWYVTKAQYAKAIVAGLTAAITSLIAALADQVVTDNEILVVIMAGLAGSGIVAAVKNGDAPA